MVSSAVGAGVIKWLLSKLAQVQVLYLAQHEAEECSSLYWQVDPF